MSAKLIIRRYREENIFQTLHVSIEENDVQSSEVNFSVWQDGISESKKKKDNERRLVVKMVSDENFGNMNLDSCSQVVDCTDKYFNAILNRKNPFRDDVNENYCLKDANKSEPDSKNMYKKYFETLNNNTKVSDIRENHYKMPQLYQKELDNKNDEIDPLVSSLEKVRKNNALIMENIHMLNRTLNYTKKKEILDLINPKPFRSYPCNACGKCFVYETGLRRHYSTTHARLDSQPRWQFVWTCTECFQVWPKQDLATKHAIQCCKSDNVDFIQEIKTSSLLQCEFCEKVFTCIPRLLKHAKMHSVTNNYQCNVCEITFSCYKTAEQHWLTCLWLKICYQFSLPKLLICNVCDRKFRNYDQLYNHRYKVEHFIQKTWDENNFNYTPTLVYQCEVCGQWFHVISQLQVHQSQYHPQFNSAVSYNSDQSTVEQRD